MIGAEPPNQNNHLRLKERKFSAPQNLNSGAGLNSQEDREGPIDNTAIGL